MNNSNIFEKIMQIAKYHGYNSVNDFALNGLKYKSSEKINRLKDPSKMPSIEIIRDISNMFEDVSLNWLISDVGDMLLGNTKNEKNVTENISNINGNNFGNKPKVKNMLPNDFHLDIISEPNSEYANVLRKIKFAKDISITDQGAPFYPMPISAGTVAELLKEPEKPNGFISIPGVSCKAYFPVIGCSFEPYIKAGGIIGVDFIDRWEILDPDCIYFIITHDQRMLKRLQRDPDNDGKMLCISPNYKSFSIDINDIKVIHKVVFYGSFV